MAQITPDEKIEQSLAYFSEHRAAYIGSGGRTGQIRDLTHEASRRFATHCLLRTIGRKSGKARIDPLLYNVYGGEIVVIGSKGGVDQDPAWSLNLRAADEAQVQVGGQAFRVTWRLAEGEERRKLWELALTNHPPYAEYQTRTQRIFPVLVLTPHEEIPAFTEADYD